jgi:hypothetical protein
MRPSFQLHSHLRVVGLLAAWTALAGCESTVALGSECPAVMGPCPVPSAPDVPTEATPPPTGMRDPPVARPLDAGSDAAGGQAMVDAKPPPAPSDADANTSRELYPEILNPSFELPPNAKPGDIAAISLVGGAMLSRWHTCQQVAGGAGLAVMRAETELPDLALDGGLPVMEPLKPSHGSSFISARPTIFVVGLFVLPLIHELPEPLRAGQRYAFAIDVRVSNEEEVTLRVGGANSGSSCDASTYTELYRTEPLAPAEPLEHPEWRTICVRFTPEREYSHLLLQAGFPAITTARLDFDNIRPIEGCPE